MIKYSRFVFLILISQLSLAQEINLTDANNAYIEEHYKTAVKAYETQIDSAQMNSELFYNLGNAYYKTNKKGLAIWAYERALKIDPQNEDAKFNLEFVQLQIVDKSEQDSPTILDWLKRLLYSPYINFWSFVSIGSSLLLSLIVIVFILSKSRKIRNLCLLSGTTIAVILIFSTTTAYFHKKALLDDSSAIVIDEEISIKLSPISKAKTSFKLHEGAKVSIEQKTEEWVQIEYNGLTGWTKEKYIKRI